MSSLDARSLAAFESLRTGSLSRRQFIQRLSALGFASTTIATFLAACGPAAPPQAPAPPPPVPTVPPTRATLPAPELAATAAPAAALTPAAVDLGRLGSVDPNPKRGGTLRLAFGVTTSNYDLQQGGNANVLCQLYSTLVRLNPVDGLKTIVPDLAERFEVAPDGLSYTFRLRSGVQFHDGTPLTADDVAATYNRMIFPPPGVVSLVKDRYSTVARIEAVDPLTVKFALNEPSAVFLLLLTDITQGIYSKKTLDANTNDLRKIQVAPGTGPFMFKEYKEGEKWTLVRNPTYWNRELPYLDSVEFVHVPAWSDRGTAVLTSQADLSWNVSKETWDEGAKRTDAIRTNRVTTFGAYQVIFNTRVKPFDDPRVRRAVHLALNRQGLIEAFSTQEQIDLSRWVPHGGEFATPRSTIATLPGYRADKSADLADARKLLADAGFPNSVPGVELLSASVPPHAEIMAPAIQDQLKTALGMEVTIRVSERSLLVEDQKAGRFTMVLDTPSGPISDFGPLANTYFKTGGSQNYGGYSNAKFDDLLKQSDRELDPTRRRALLDQMQDLLDQDPPWLFIGFTDHLLMWRANVKGLALDKRVQSEWGRVEVAWLDT
ncbi:MAG: ABC transporter substrate-binding protein [Chloroflexota bacterium]|nr:ABC transporter substrate-binding protein [Chloroflexota bacterium]